MDLSSRVSTPRTNHGAQPPFLINSLPPPHPSRPLPPLNPPPPLPLSTHTPAPTARGCGGHPPPRRPSVLPHLPPTSFHPRTLLTRARCAGCPDVAGRMGGAGRGVYRERTRKRGPSRQPHHAHEHTHHAPSSPRARAHSPESPRTDLACEAGRPAGGWAARVVGYPGISVSVPGHCRPAPVGRPAEAAADQIWARAPTTRAARSRTPSFWESGESGKPEPDPRREEFRTRAGRFRLLEIRVWKS